MFALLPIVCFLTVCTVSAADTAYATQKQLQATYQTLRRRHPGAPERNILAQIGYGLDITHPRDPDNLQRSSRFAKMSREGSYTCCGCSALFCYAGCVNYCAGDIEKAAVGFLCGAVAAWAVCYDINTTLRDNRCIDSLKARLGNPPEVQTMAAPPAASARSASQD